MTAPATDVAAAVETAIGTTGGAGVLAHGVHWTIIVAGGVAMTALVLPSVVDRVAPRLLARVSAPRDDHEARVHALRADLAAGRLSTAGALLAPAACTATPARGHDATDAAPTDVPVSARLSLPLALVASTGAAGVHAAVGPAHLAGQPVLAAFFLLCACAQLGWAGLALRRVGPTLALAGALGNAALVLLWVLSRTAGLPVVASGAEPVGPWDLLATGWHVVAALACAHLLVRGGPQTGPAGWWEWAPAARRFLVVSVLALCVVSLSGAGA